MELPSALRRARSVWSVATDPLFDAQWYRWLNPDAPRSRFGAAAHYLRSRDAATAVPSPEFDSAAYLRLHSDVPDSGLDPLEHFHSYGRREGRAAPILRRRFFVRADGSTDRDGLAGFLAGAALRNDRSRAVPHLRATLPRDRVLFGTLLELLVAPTDAAARRAVRTAKSTRRVAPVEARIVIESGKGDGERDVLATWCSLAADPQVAPATIEVESLPAGDAASSPTYDGVTIRIRAGALVLPGSVAALAAAAAATGRPVFGDLVGPDGTREDRWRRSAALTERHSILRAEGPDPKGTPLLVPAAVSVRWAEFAPSDEPRALVIDQRVPQLDRDSGSLSAVSFMESLLGLGYRVTFVPADLDFDPRHSFVLESLGIEVVDRREVDDPATVAASGAFDVALLLRPETVSRFAPVIRGSSAQTRIVSLPMDVHFLRLEGAAGISGRAADRADAQRHRTMELANLELVDLTVTGSSEEVTLLRALSPGARVELLPAARPELSPEPVPFDERLDMVFLGGFEHAPNLDSIAWFLDEIWPEVASRLPQARLAVYGSHMPDELRARGTDRVLMHGYVERLEEAFRTARLFVVPLRFGAGFKGKIVSAMRAGVPVVTTAVGASGMELRSVVVADGAEGFAAALIELWDDEARIRRLAERTRAEAARRFAPAVQQRVLGGLLAELGVRATPRLRRTAEGPRPQRT